MNTKWSYVFMIIATIITIVGLVTGKFFFFLIWLPLAFLFKKKEE